MYLTTCLHRLLYRIVLFFLTISSEDDDEGEEGEDEDEDDESEEDTSSNIVMVSSVRSPYLAGNGKQHFFEKKLWNTNSPWSMPA